MRSLSRYHLSNPSAVLMRSLSQYHFSNPSAALMRSLSQYHLYTPSAALMRSLPRYHLSTPSAVLMCSRPQAQSRDQAESLNSVKNALAAANEKLAALGRCLRMLVNQVCMYRLMHKTQTYKWCDFSCRCSSARSKKSEKGFRQSHTMHARVVD